MQLLPFYARITAALSQHFPDMGATVAHACLAAFRGFTKSKATAARTLEPRTRTARYLCELAKFRVVSAGEHPLPHVSVHRRHCRSTLRVYEQLLPGNVLLRCSK